MAGVIEHVRPPRCPQSGADVPLVNVAATKTRGYQAQCPSCNKMLWLNKQPNPDGVSLDFTFPEHIGVQP